MRLRNVLSVCLALAVVSASAWAADEQGEPVPERLEEEKYEGVSPALPRRNPLPPPRGAGAQLVWTGFQKEGEGGRVFLQTTADVPFDVQAQGKRVIVVLHGCGIHLDNNQRRLDTRFFSTPVLAVQARKRKKDTEITITLRSAVEPRSRTEPAPEGTRFLVIDFPAPTHQGTAATTP